MAEQVDFCLECSEIRVELVEVLKTTKRLKDKKGYVTEKDIIEKMRTDINVPGETGNNKIKETLQYACELKLYDDITYSVNKSLREAKCTVCSDNIVPFNYKNYNVEANYVDRETFESPA